MREIVAVLHNVRSLHNVGSIFRTADAAGVRKVYLCGITPGPVDRLGHVRSQLAKVALGAERYVPWEKSPSAVRTLKKLKQEGYHIFAIEQSRRSTPYHLLNVKGRSVAKAMERRRQMSKVALVLGSETKGLPQSVLKLADKTLEIPMFGKKESLNVAVAFGVVVYHLRVQGRSLDHRVGLVSIWGLVDRNK